MALKKEKTGDENAKFQIWDFTFYDAIYKKKVYNIDEDLIKEYFPSEHVKSATLEIYQELLGLEFKHIPDAETWEKSVSLYEVRDSQSRQVLGHFYLDLYPRPNKFNHAACFGLVARAKIGNQI